MSRRHAEETELTVAGILHLAQKTDIQEMCWIALYNAMTSQEPSPERQIVLYLPGHSL